MNVWGTVGEKHLICNIILDPCIIAGLNTGVSKLGPGRPVSCRVKPETLLDFRLSQTKDWHRETMPICYVPLVMPLCFRWLALSLSHFLRFNPPETAIGSRSSQSSLTCRSQSHKSTDGSRKFCGRSERETPTNAFKPQNICPYKSYKSTNITFVTSAKE